MEATTETAMKKPAANGASTSRLAKVQRGKINAPVRVVVFGSEGVGKSSLAASSPNPIWFDVEDGSGRLDVARYTFRDVSGGHVPRTYQEILAGIDDLMASPHEFQTLVIDTADRLESLLWAHVIEREKLTAKNPTSLTSIESFGYGKGFQIAVDEWRALCLRLDRLRAARGMSIVFLAHSQIRTFKNPIGDDYDRYHMRINEKAAGFLREWSDITTFACFEEATKRGDNDKAKGYSTGARLLKFERAAGYDAKTRLALPPEIVMAAANPWGPLAKAIDDAQNLTPEVLAALIATETARIGDPVLSEKVAAEVKAANGNTATLHRFLSALQKRPEVTTDTITKENE